MIFEWSTKISEIGENVAIKNALSWYVSYSYAFIVHDRATDKKKNPNTFF